MLPQSTPVPLMDDALDDLFQANIVNITGIVGSLVRPRFQPEPAAHPEHNVDWVAFGVVTQDADTFPSITHDPNGDSGAGTDLVERDELITLNLSFYGPNNGRLSSQYREGLFVEQNRWDLAAQGVGLVSVGPVINLPALLKDKWVKRKDTKVIFRRRSGRVYKVPSLVKASATINTDPRVTTVIIQ